MMRKLVSFIFLAAVVSVAIAQAPNSLKVCVVENWNVENDPCSPSFMDCGAFLITGVGAPGRGNLVWCDDSDSLIDYIGPTRTSSGGVYAFGASGAPNYTQTFTNKTSVVLAHGLGTDNVIVQCHEDDDTMLWPNSISYARFDPFDATVTFAASQSGRCIVNGLMNSGRFTSGFVSSVSVSILGSAHGLGNQFLNVSCYDTTASPAELVYPDDITIASGTFDVVIRFKVAETGTCVVQ